MTAVQKKLSALAIAAAFAGSAFAQTNVTIYGVADAGFVNSSGDRANGAKNANFNGINSGIMSGSRLGFKGEEGLGNGLKAVFLLEYRWVLMSTVASAALPVPQRTAASPTSA